MKKISTVFYFLCLAFIGTLLQTSCSGSSTTKASSSCSTSGPSSICATTDPSPNGGTFTGVGGDTNVMTVTAGNCGFSNNINMPCANVQICTPGTATCQTIPNVLVDTGSYGLRLFRSVITSVTLNPVQVTIAATTYNVGQCALFGSGSDWGQLMYADVKLGTEPTISNLPIQVIDSTFGTVPTSCGQVDTAPSDAGFNGIIGIGLSAADCGTYCTTHANNGMYYKCNGASCTGVTLPDTCDGTGTTACQVQNPISSLPVDPGNGGVADNNGVVLEFAHVPRTGQSSLTGHVLFGIGTRTNNTPGAVKTFTANGYNEFTTTYYGTTLDESFIDSGSNGNIFPSTVVCIEGCGNGFYCPQNCSSYNLTATNIGQNAISDTVTFQAYDLGSLSASNAVFSNVTGEFNSNTFDWGFPFFLGRTVYVGIEGKTSSLGTGPYWAY